MADSCHHRLRTLIAGLAAPDQDSEARDAIRRLIDRIVATPVPTGGKRHKLDLTLHAEAASRCEHPD